MIEVKGLKKSFGTQKVLDGLTLKIPKGKITVILGRSGEGKSVLIKHLIGLLRPDSGTVIVKGRDLLSMDSIELNDFRKNFGMLFQQAALFDSMTVFQNIAFPLEEHTQKTETEILKQVKHLVELVGLTENVLQKYPSELSGGMKKRVGLARAIALEPEILLYDEPTTGLDPIMTDVIDHLILETQKKLGVTSVVISHDVKATFAIADKIAMLHEGKIHLEGTPEEFRKSNDPVVKNFLEGKARQEELK